LAIALLALALLGTIARAQPPPFGWTEQHFDVGNSQNVYRQGTGAWSGWSEEQHEYPWGGSRTVTAPDGTSVFCSTAKIGSSRDTYCSP
jgi:hypothetical protein